MKKIILTSLIVFIGLLGLSQEIAQPHKAIVKLANERFELKNFGEAKKNFSQLISYYPSNAEFNYKFAVCNVMLGGDPDASIVHLSYAQSAGYGNDVDYFLGRAYHRNYDFNKAIKSFQKYKMQASKHDVSERNVDRYIDMCRNGKGLLNSIKDVVVLDKKQGTSDNFFRFYDLDKLGGKILAIPEELKTKQDKKHNFNGVFYFSGNNETIYYASYGKTGETGKDIYEAHLLPNGKFGRSIKLKGDINTQYDEDYAFLHADGRTMYFSSKGHNSMGGYDVFRSDYDEGTSTFRNVVNMDFAVNTPDDDIFYISDSKNDNAWFSSSRNVGEKQMNIYNVKVKGIPINLIFIQGNFIADFDENIKNAQIVMKDELTGKIISKVNTKSTTGDYILSLTKPGLYKIEVKSESSTIIHEGYVQVPVYEEAVALGQELRLIKESGQEKLIINNSFDLPLDADIAELSKEFLRRKSGLEIAPEEEIIEEFVEDVHIAKTAKNAILSAGFTEGTSIDNILANSKNDVASINREIKEIEINNKAAFSYALTKQSEADSKLKESRDLYEAAEKLDGNEYRTKILESNRLLIEAEDLSTDAKAAYRIAKRSEKIAIEKKDAVEDLNNQIALIEKSNNEEDFKSLTNVLRTEKNRINNKKGNKALTPGEIANQEVSELEDVQEVLLAQVKETSDTRTRINSRINIKKSSLAKLSKKKEIEETNQEIEALEEQLAITNENLVKILKEVKKNGTEEVILKKEAEFFENRYINPDQIYLADVNASEERVNQNLGSTSRAIRERKMTFGTNPKIVEIVREEYPEVLSWSSDDEMAELIVDHSMDDAEKGSKKENLENYQVMIAIEKEVAKIENEKSDYLIDVKHSKDDNQYLKLEEKAKNLELQHNDIYAQQLNEVQLTDKEVDNVILTVDPKYNAAIQEKLAETNEVVGLLNVREYRKDLKEQLIYLAKNNKQAIIQEDNPRNLKKLIKKDVEFQSAINELDNEINDVNLFVIAYDTENKGIIDSKRSSAEILPEQIELTEKYIETLETVSKSVDDEMHSGVEHKRREALREIQYEISNEIIAAQNKLDSYNSDLDLTISTEGQFADNREDESTNIQGEYHSLPASEQGAISSLRGEYSDVFSDEENADLSMNDKIIIAIDKKLHEQKMRLNSNVNAEEKAIIKMDMKSLVDIREKVDAEEYVFVNYQRGRVNTGSGIADNTNNTEVAESIEQRNIHVEESDTIEETSVSQKDNSSVTTDDIGIETDVVVEQADEFNDVNVDENDIAENDIAENDIVNSIKKSEALDISARNEDKMIADEEEPKINKNIDADVDIQVAEAIERSNLEEQQMKEINFAFAPEKKTLPMESYGTQLFDEAETSFRGTENEFTNLPTIRKIQAEIVGLENAVIDGEVKNNERKLNKKFEKLYSDLAYEEIKLANRLETHTAHVIEQQQLEIDQLEGLNKSKVINQTLTKAKIKKLKKEIETWQKNAEGKRYQITKSNDELERNFLAREAFAFESDVIKNQKKIIYLYSNVDKIAQLDEGTIDKMQSGDYNYALDNKSTIETVLSGKIQSDLDKVKHGEEPKYSPTYVNYINHLKELQINIDRQEQQQSQLTDLRGLIHQNENDLSELENEFNHASSKKERKVLLDQMNAKRTHIDNLVIDKNNVNDQVMALSTEIKAALVKAEFLYDRAQTNEQNLDVTGVELSDSNGKSKSVPNNTREIENGDGANVDETSLSNDAVVSDEEVADTSSADFDEINDVNNNKSTEQAIVDDVDDVPVDDVELVNDVEIINENTTADNNIETPNTTDFQILQNEKRKGKIQMNTDIPSGVIYRIQIGAFSKPVDSNRFAEFTPLSGESVGNGIVRYYVGWFNSYDDAQYVLKGVKDEGYQDAFIVAYVDKKKSSIGEAIQKSNEIVTAMSTNETSSSFDEKALLDYYYSYPNAVKAKLITPSTGLFFTVQIGVFSKPLTAQELGEDSELNVDILPSKKVRYSSGRFQDLAIAKTRNNKMHQKGFDDSFVTAYFNGKRISIANAKKLFGIDQEEKNATDLSLEDVSDEEVGIAKTVSEEGNLNMDSLYEPSLKKSGTNSELDLEKETPIVVKTVVTQTTLNGEGVHIISMEYDVFIGKYGNDIPLNLTKAINELKESVDVLQKTEGADTVYYTARVKTLQEARNIQKDFKNAGFEETEIRAFRVE